MTREIGLPWDNVHSYCSPPCELQKEGNGYELLRKSQVLTSSLVILILPETQEDLTLGATAGIEQDSELATD